MHGMGLITQTDCVKLLQFKYRENYVGTDSCRINKTEKHLIQDRPHILLK